MLLKRSQQFLAQYSFMASINNLRGVGCTEAPRVVLFHHYHVNKDVLFRSESRYCNGRIICNEPYCPQIGVFSLTVRKEKLQRDFESSRSRKSRCYDRACPAQTHALGQMPLHIELVTRAKVLDEFGDEKSLSSVMAIRFARRCCRFHAAELIAKRHPEIICSVCTSLSRN